MPGKYYKRRTMPRNKLTKTKEEVVHSNVETKESSMQDDEPMMANHKFWGNKPVMDYNLKPVRSQEIEDITKRVIYSRENSLNLPVDFEWTELDPKNDAHMVELSDFLTKYYLNDQSGRFGLKYTASFLKWCLGFNSFVIGLRTKSGMLCGTIAVTFRDMVVYDKTEKMAEANFLCAHPSLRKKNISSVLIDEASRRSVKKGVTHGFFTTERSIPSPASTIRMYHRPINYMKLLKHKFTVITGVDDDVANKYYSNTSIFPVNYIEASVKNYEDVFRLYNESSRRYNVYQKYSFEEFIHYYFENTHMKTYVIFDKDGKINDFVSFFILPTLVNGSEETIENAYIYYYSAINMSAEDIIDNTITICYHLKLDVLTVTDILKTRDALLLNNKRINEDSDNEEYKRGYDLKFLKGSGRLRFHFFNWECPRFKASQLAFVTF